LHWFWAAGREEEFWFGEGLDLVESGVGSDFAEEESCGSDVDEGEFGDNVIDDFDACERQRALAEDFWFVVAGGVLHGDENAFGAGDKVHGAAHALEHFPRNGPVGEGSLFIDLQRAEDGEVDVAAANHGERIGGGKIGSAGKFANCLFSGVDEVGIDLGIERVGADAEHPVFGLENDLHALGDKVGDEGRHANAEIDVIAVA